LFKDEGAFVRIGPKHYIHVTFSGFGDGEYFFFLLQPAIGFQYVLQVGIGSVAINISQNNRLVFSARYTQNKKTLAGRSNFYRLGSLT
jgi:hypothetical protein